MNFRVILFLLNSFVLIKCESLLENYHFPHYGQSRLTEQTTENTLRNQVKPKANITKLKPKPILQKNVSVEDILHFEVNNKNPQWNKIDQIEKEFRNIIGMRGLKYTFKRDQFWRSWRRVSFSGEFKVINYKCENSVNFTNCYNGGYWVIEEKPPPCPYELFSVSKKEKICAIHIDKYYAFKKNCSDVINVGDLSGDCDNPIVTEMRVMKLFNSKVPERFPSVICGGRDSCRILTLYNIATDNISFRIVNSENKVIYSRVMKEGTNYACVENCGSMDPDSRIITKL